MSSAPPPSPLESMLCGGASGALASLASNPFDVAKLRLQLQGERVPPSSAASRVLYYDGVFGCLRTMVRDEGASALYRGIKAAMAFNLSMNMVRFGTYEALRSEHSRRSTTATATAAATAATASTNPAAATPPPSTAPPSFLANAACGAVAGVAGAAVGAPFNLVKIREHAYTGSRRLATTTSTTTTAGAVRPRPPHWGGLFSLDHRPSSLSPHPSLTISHFSSSTAPPSSSAPSAPSAAYGGYQHRPAGGLYKTLLDMWSKEGGGGFGGHRAVFTGTQTLMARIALGTASQFAVYDAAKDTLVRHGGASPTSSLTHLASGVVSGAVTTVAFHPIDVLYSRMANQKVVVAGRGRGRGGGRGGGGGVGGGGGGGGAWYSGPLDCLKQMFKAEGVKGMYRGAAASFARVGTHTAATFVIMEQLKNLWREEAGLEVEEGWGERAVTRDARLS